jgi:PEP-CTERM motif
MRLPIRFLVAAAILATATIAARADAIAGMAGGSSSFIQINDPEGISWTQTGSYTDVTISAFLSSYGGINGTGTIYLTDQIGPGTTVANQIAETTVSGLAFGPATATTLFSGLDLGPGTYYLISASNLGGGGVGWNIYDGNAAIPGISGTNNPDEFGFGEAGYPPASSFESVGTHELDFSVTGDIAATPEPSSLILLGTGLFGIVGMTRRKYLGH